MNELNIEKAYEIISEKLALWLKELIRILPNLLLAVVVLVVGLFVARLIKNLAARFIRKVITNHTLSGLFISVVYVLMIGIVLFTVLSILRLDKAVTSLLAGAGILGLALAFAFQDIASNFMSGIFISLRRPINIGDIVEVKGYMGRVKEINLRDTVIHTFQGKMVIVPNKDVFQNPIENYTKLGKRRVDLKVGVSYGDDLEKVKQVALAAVKDINELSPTDEIAFFYTEFGDSSINFELRLWVGSPEQQAYWSVCSQAVVKIKAAFDQNDITIPFPIRTLDFGIKGGVPLQKMPISVKSDNPESSV